MASQNSVLGVTTLNDTTADCCEINQSVSKNIADLLLLPYLLNVRISFSQQAIIRSMLFKRSKALNQIMKKHISLLNRHHLKATVRWGGSVLSYCPRNPHGKGGNEERRRRNKQKKQINKKHHPKKRFFTSQVVPN